ncbi:MAG: class D sortase [Anaerolineales bacterium]|nr:class D sortase [Anaerolineales bacterium]MDW8276386.1 class D sortase [Anaerolineales bacterium]
MPERRPEDLSVEELRRLLLEKRRVRRQDRLERFRRTGRVIALAAEAQAEGDEAGAMLVETPAGFRPLPRRRAWTDTVLLFVEVIAVIALIGVVLNAFSIWRTLNQEVAAAMEQPTPVPTPLITAVVLPSGHTPPTAENGAQFNEAEIPEHLRPIAQTIASVPLPTASPAQAIRIQIPAINVDAPVVQGDSWEQLKKGVGQHIGTPNPGENGNIVLSAHNDIFGEIFRELDKLQPGDVVILYTAQRQYTYVVIGTQIVEPTRVEVMAPTPNATLTLISCYPYLVDTERIVVSAVLQTP